MKAYKGFDKDLKCRGFQYEIGKEYTEEDAEICRKGFHACENPMDVFGYYAPADSRYCEVDLDANEQTSDDSKRVGSQIKVSAEIGLMGLVKVGVEYIKSRIDWTNSTSANTGDYSAATNTGDRSAAAVEGMDSIAVATGREGKAKGSLGCFLVLAEWEKKDGRFHIKTVKTIKVDGKTIKPGVFYTLKNGTFVEEGND